MSDDSFDVDITFFFFLVILGFGCAGCSGS